MTQHNTSFPHLTQLNGSFQSLQRKNGFIEYRVTQENLWVRSNFDGKNVKAKEVAAACNAYLWSILSVLVYVTNLNNNKNGLYLIAQTLWFLLTLLYYFGYKYE